MRQRKDVKSRECRLGYRGRRVGGVRSCALCVLLAFEVSANSYDASSRASVGGIVEDGTRPARPWQRPNRRSTDHLVSVAMR